MRYPGGKHKLADFISQICLDNEIDGHYIEPFAGGASVALHLLINKIVKHITLNDSDRSIYAFWYTALNHTEALCRLIVDTKVDIYNYQKAKRVQHHQLTADLVDLGFSTFFLNRTNRSGIIHHAGSIGGADQNGRYKIDCRYNKSALIKRIERIAQHTNSIKLYNLDASQLIDKIQHAGENLNSLFYLDPPYYQKGKTLYRHHFNQEDHTYFADKIKSLTKTSWLLSYDDTPFIRKLYSWTPSYKYTLNHYINNFRRGREILFYKEGMKITQTIKTDIHQQEFQNLLI